MRSKTTKKTVAALGLIAIIAIFGVVGVIKKNENQALGQDNSVSQASDLISLKSFSQLILSKQKVLLLDIRSKNDYMASHIPDSISMPHYDILLKSDDLAPFKDWETILICDTEECSVMQRAIRDLKLAGFTKIKRLEGGFTAYKDAGLATATQAKLVQDDLIKLLTQIEVPEITVADLNTELENKKVILLDVRTEGEYLTGFIKGAINVPLSTVAEWITNNEANKNKTIVVYDLDTSLARIATKSLIDANYTDVKALTGGIEEWQAQNNPIEIDETKSSQDNNQNTEELNTESNLQELLNY